jgi:hypothetical protein
MSHMWPCSGWGLPCHPGHPGCGALLPHRFTLACARPRRARPSAVCSLWHCPAGRPDWPLASTLPCGVPTFLNDVTRGPVAAITRPTHRRLQCAPSLRRLRTGRRIHRRLPPPAPPCSRPAPPASPLADDPRRASTDQGDGAHDRGPTDRRGRTGATAAKCRERGGGSTPRDRSRSRPALASLADPGDGVLTGRRRVRPIRSPPSSTPRSRRITTECPPKSSPWGTCPRPMQEGPPFRRAVVGCRCAGEAGFADRRGP